MNHRKIFWAYGILLIAVSALVQPLYVYGLSVCDYEACNITVKFANGGSIEVDNALLSFGQQGKVFLGEGGSIQLGSGGYLSQITEEDILSGRMLESGSLIHLGEGGKLIFSAGGYFISGSGGNIESIGDYPAAINDASLVTIDGRGVAVNLNKIRQPSQKVMLMAEQISLGTGVATGLDINADTIEVQGQSIAVDSIGAEVLLLDGNAELDRSGLTECSGLTLSVVAMATDPPCVGSIFVVANDFDLSADSLLDINALTVDEEVAIESVSKTTVDANTTDMIVAEEPVSSFKIEQTNNKGGGVFDLPWLLLGIAILILLACNHHRQSNRIAY